MDEEKYSILIIEDDVDVAEMLNAYFRVQGYAVFVSNWGEEGVQSVIAQRPDLIILDIRLPDIDGFEVARRLRSDRRAASIPIIFLTEKRDRADKLQGLEIGADDYITKPFDIQELRLRVRNAIKRTKLDTIANPVTGLPEGDVVNETVREVIKNINWSIILIALKNMDIFRESYGFIASDDVLRAFSLLIVNTLKESGIKEVFIGHLSPTDFIILNFPVSSSFVLTEKLNERLTQILDYFYPIKDRETAASTSDRLKVKTIHLESDNFRVTSIEDIKTALID